MSFKNSTIHEMKARSFLIAVLLIAVSLPAIYPIITPGYFPIHDDTQVARVDQMYKALSSGQFPVRWVPDLGYEYGYPIFNFYNPLPYYFGALFMFFGADALIAAKIMFIIPIIGSALGMYILAITILRSDLAAARSDLSRMAAFLAAILYVYAPYHAVQIYVRGAVAEYWAYAILPLVFYAIWKNRVILGGISLAALITSHNLTAFMSIPFLALVSIIRFLSSSRARREIQRSDLNRPDSVGARFLDFARNDSTYSANFISTIILALGLSAFFWLPAIAEAGKTQVSQMVFENFDPPALHLIKPFQLLSGQWGWGGSSPGTDDGLSLQLGKVHLVGSLAAIAILIYYYIAKKTIKQSNNLTIFSMVSLLFSVFMLLPASRPIWDLFPLLSYIQFPWRFLTFASLFSSILAAWTIWTVIKIVSSRATGGSVAISGIATSPRRRVGAPRNDNKNYSLVIVSCFLFIISSLKFFQPQFKYPTSAQELTSRERILWEVSRRSDEYLPVGFTRPTTLEEALRIDNSMNQTLVDGLKKSTPVRRIGNTISIFTVIGMIGYYERLYRRRRR